MCGAKSLSEQMLANIKWVPGNIFWWNCDQSNFHSRKSIGNVYKTEAILSRSQCVNTNVAHSNHSGLNINDGGLWTVAIYLQFAESVQVVWYKYLWQVPVPCWSQIIASVRGTIPNLTIHEREVIYVLERNLQASYEFNNCSHTCAYSAILRLKSINNKSIEAIELSNLDTTWHLGKGGTEWDNPLQRFRTKWCCATATNQSILPRILGISDIYRWMIGPLWIHIYIYLFLLGRWQEISGETLFFSHFFYFPLSTLLKDMCILLLVKPAFYFWPYFLLKHLSDFP